MPMMQEGFTALLFVNSYIEVTEGFAEISQRADVKLRNEETKNQEPKKQEPKNREPKG